MKIFFTLLLLMNFQLFSLTDDIDSIYQYSNNILYSNSEINFDLSNEKLWELKDNFNITKRKYPIISSLNIEYTEKLLELEKINQSLKLSTASNDTTNMIINLYQKGKTILNFFDRMDYRLDSYTSNFNPQVNQVGINSLEQASDLIFTSNLNKFLLPSIHYQLYLFNDDYDGYKMDYDLRIATDYENIDPIIYGYSIMEQSYRSGQNWNDYKNDFYDLINYRNNFKTNFFYNSELNLENIDISKDTLMKYHNYHIFANLYKIFDDLGDLDSSYKYIKKMNDLNYYGKNFNFEDQKLYLLDLEYRHEYTDEKNGKIIVNEMDSIYSLKIHSENSSKYYLKKFFELDNKLWTQNESYIPLKKLLLI